MAGGTGFEGFQKAFPERFFDVAIAEQHGVTFSAGLASRGIVPVFAVYSSFLQRAYDQIVHDVCMQNLHVVFAVDRAGIVGDQFRLTICHRLPVFRKSCFRRSTWVSHCDRTIPAVDRKIQHFL